MQPKADKVESLPTVRRPTPTELAGFFTGGTLGAYTAGPLGAAVGMVIGAVLASLAERAIDRSAGRPAAHGQRSNR